MRLIVPLIFLIVLDYYSFSAIRAHCEASSVFRSLLFYLFLACTLITYSYLLVYSNSSFLQHHPQIESIARVITMISIVAKIPIAALLIVDDLRRILFAVFNLTGPEIERSTSRSAFLSKLAIIAGAIPFVTLAYGALRNAYRYKIYRQKIAIDGLPEALKGLKIVQISDIHAGSLTRSEPLKRAVEMINELKADIVCFTGDLVNSNASEMEPYLPIFSQIKAKHGVFSITGNHDYYGRDPNNFERLISMHSKLGWDLLLNENRILDIGDSKIAVIGVENISAKPFFPKRGNLKEAYDGCDDCYVKVLMSHDPSHWMMEVIPSFRDIDLTLSGHTHGFQFGIEIPNLVKWSPAQYIYDQWAGLYKNGKQFLYVNRGFGFLGYPGRVGILPEITELVLE